MQASKWPFNFFKHGYTVSGIIALQAEAASAAHIAAPV
jgi:hypothetical protein